jgi:hypothetical protein
MQDNKIIYKEIILILLNMELQTITSSETGPSMTSSI